MYIELLVILPEARRQRLGTRMMREAEQIARDRGCISMWLDTFSFQARGFYEKLGFHVFGTLPDQPPGAHRHVMLKRLD